MNQQKLSKVIGMALKRAGYAPDPARVASIVGDLELAFEIDGDAPAAEQAPENSNPFPGHVFTDTPAPKSPDLDRHTGSAIIRSPDNAGMIPQYESQPVIITASEIPRSAKLPSKPAAKGGMSRLNLNLYSSPKGAGIEELLDWAKDNENFPERISITPRGRENKMVINRFITPMYSAKTVNGEDTSGVVISYRLPEADVSAEARKMVMAAEIKEGFPDPRKIMQGLAAAAIISHGIRPSRIDGVEPTGPGLAERAGISMRDAMSVARVDQATGKIFHSGHSIEMRPETQRAIQSDVPREIDERTSERLPEINYEAVGE